MPDTLSAGTIIRDNRGNAIAELLTDIHRHDMPKAYTIRMLDGSPQPEAGRMVPAHLARAMRQAFGPQD